MWQHSVQVIVSSVTSQNDNDKASDMKYKKGLIYAAMTAALSACSSGSDSTSTDSNSQGDVFTGRFVDAAVMGMAYQTATQSGTTDSDGSFSYRANESVSFSIGDIVLPDVLGSPLVTPLDVFATDSIADTQVVNLTRLLQTLDSDANLDNGISISDDAISSATGLTIDFGSVNFDTDVTNLVANSGSSNTSLITPEDAMDHFMETLFTEGVQERPDESTDVNVVQPTTGTGNATSLHPRVGATAEFRNIFHGIAGTLTVLDDRTLQVTGFEYDGEGPSVFFYLGTGGEYAARDGGILVGNRLNRSTPYVGETITINLPDGVTLDDFDGVSVWCDIFFANFGDAVF